MAQLPMSKEGLDLAADEVIRFTSELAAEASRVAARNDAEQASAAHVRRAARHLYSSGSSRAAQALNSVGGLLAGAAASTLVTFLLVRPVHAVGSVISVGALVAGAVMLTMGLTRK